MIDQDPVVIKMNVPQAPLPVQKLPRFPWLKSFFGPRSTKIITAVSAIVISITMVSVAIFTILANNAGFQAKHSLDTLPKAPASAQKNAAALPGGGTATGVSSCTGTNCPAVTLTADPSTVSLGGVAKLTWKVINKPTSCVASDDWSGTKADSGTETTPSLSKSQTYLFTLTCKNATGTGFSTVSVGTATKSGGSGSVTQRPTVTLAAYPTTVFTGESTQLKWDVTNNPTSCTASGDWSGLKTASGTQSTAGLTSAKQYSYGLQCTNSAGTSQLVTIPVSAVDPPPGLPVVTLSSTPVGSTTPGSSVTLNWSTTNNPSSCSASGDWSGAKPGTGSFNTGALGSIRPYAYTLNCTNSTGSLDATVNVNVLPNPPAISLTVNPASILVGNSATISWNVANNTAGTTCTASGDWPGNLSITPTSSGTRNTGTLSTARTYSYSLSCKNEGGSGAPKTATLAVSLPAPPAVSISVSPISINTGQSATVTWSATNNPSSCTPSGDLTAPITPASGGSKSTGTLSTARTYTYSLNCTNAGGTSNTATTSLAVGSGTSSSPPVVTISAAPASISTGSASTISWSATNSPTSCSAGGTTSTWVSSPGASGSASTGAIAAAGTRTYSITCSNSAGSGTKSATLTIVALPTVSVSLAASTITTGTATTYSWSTTGASSCTGGGVLSGSKASSGGPVTTGTQTTTGTFNYTITCVNSIGGSVSGTALLTVNTAAAVYCSGKTPCYGPNDLLTHTTSANCWGYNAGRVVDVTNLNSGYHKSQQGNLLPSGFTADCGNVNLGTYLSGGASISGIGSHNHGSAPKNNTGVIASYLVGYYDATKP